MAASLKFGNGNWATKEGSTLAYSDKNGNFKPLPFDFTRASNASVVNKQGLVETVGNGIPRIDFADSENGALKLEPQSTNLIPYSSDLSAWSKLNSTVTESSVLSLDGINNSYVYERTSGSSSYIYRTVSLSNTTVYTLSFFAKSGTSTNVRADIWDSVQSHQCSIDVDLVTKAVSNFIGTSYKIEDYINGWMRISVTFISENSFGTTFNRYFNRDSVGTELYIWGAQLEQQSYVTSYIPTEGSAVTRNKDVCDNTNIPTLLGQTEGSFLIEVNKSVANAEIFSFNRSTSNSFHVFANAGSGYYQVIAYYEGGFYNKPTFLPSTDKVKIAVSYKNNEYKLYANGAEIFSSNVFTWTPNVPLEDLYFNKGGYIGGNKTSEIKALVVWKEALSDEELTELTQV